MVVNIWPVALQQQCIYNAKIYINERTWTKTNEKTNEKSNVKTNEKNTTRIDTS